MDFTCIVAEDDVIERDMLTLQLNKIPGIQLLAAYGSGMEAMAACQQQRPDIILSDIDMPDMSGMELLKSLPNPPAFIFITSHTDYAVESYELDAVDYIIKPVTLARVTKAVNKATEYLKVKQQVKELPAEPISLQDASSDFFYISETKGYTKLLYKDVVHIEGMRDFSKIYTLTGKPHVVLANLKSIEKQLPAKDFLRVHRQSIINLNHIKAIVDHSVELEQSHTVVFSPLYKQELLNRTVHVKKISRFA